MSPNSIHGVSSPPCIELIVLQNHSQRVDIFASFKEAFSFGICLPEDFLQQQTRGSDRHERGGTLHYMDEILLRSMSNIRLMDIILTEVERHSDLHEPLVADDLLPTGDQIGQFLLFLQPDPEHVL